jgi:hypothetical protein
VARKSSGQKLLRVPEEELKSSTIETTIGYYKFLLIGGPESDLLPNSHINCTSNVGNRSKTFYETLIRNNFIFISSNALLSLALLKLFKGDQYSIENIYKKIFKEGVLGLVSSGIIFYDGTDVSILPLE